MNHDKYVKDKNVKEIEVFGVKMTVFDNGDVYVWTSGDIHVLKCRNLFTEKK